MRKICLAVALAVSVALCGCARWTEFTDKVETVVASVTSAKVPAKSILVAATTFNGVELALARYLRLPPCRAGLSACRNPALTQPINAGVLSGREARDALMQFLKDHPDEQLGPKGAYDALVAATKALQAIIEKYNIGGAS